MIFTVNDLFSVALREGLMAFERNVVYLSVISFTVLLGVLTVGSGQKIIPFIAILLVLSLVMYVIPFIRRLRRLNRIICSLEIAGDLITVKTTGVTSLKGLVRMESKEISIPTNAFVTTRKKNNIIPLNYTANLYIFSYNNKSYYLVDRFFDDFATLKKMLSLD
jgi:hypothetical protein